MVYIPQPHYRESQCGHTNQCCCVYREYIYALPTYYTHPCGREYIGDELVKMNGQPCTRCNDIIDIGHKLKKEPFTINGKPSTRCNDIGDIGPKLKDKPFTISLKKLSLWESIFGRSLYSKVPEKES